MIAAAAAFALPNVVPIAAASPATTTTVAAGAERDGNDYRDDKLEHHHDEHPVGSDVHHFATFNPSESDDQRLEPGFDNHGCATDIDDRAVHHLDPGVINHGCATDVHHPAVHHQ